MDHITRMVGSHRFGLFLSFFEAVFGERETRPQAQRPFVLVYGSSSLDSTVLAHKDSRSAAGTVDNQKRNTAFYGVFFSPQESDYKSFMRRSYFLADTRWFGANVF